MPLAALRRVNPRALSSLTEPFVFTLDARSLVDVVAFSGQSLFVFNDDPYHYYKSWSGVDNTAILGSFGFDNY
jgi:hypothetical protein